MDDFYVPSAYYCILIETKNSMYFLSRIHICNVREYAKVEAYLALKIKEDIHVTPI